MRPLRRLSEGPIIVNPPGELCAARGGGPPVDPARPFHIAGPAACAAYFPAVISVRHR